MKNPDKDAADALLTQGATGVRKSRLSTGLDLAASEALTEPAPEVEELGSSGVPFQHGERSLSERPISARGEDLIGSVLADRYQVQALLGRGGMGTVYRAEHVHMKKPVALKVLHPHMSANPEIVARFEREAVAAGRLQHPGIVTATDFGIFGDGSFYLALEFVDGKSLTDVLKETGPLDEERALGIAYQMTSALSAAHAVGIVHRDLKPDNVMLVRTGDDEDFVKVLDFGIAKMHSEEEEGEQQSLTRAGLVFGTPEYMSPEQAMGHDADARSDVYAVGMILYEMLVGQSPFHAEDVTAMLTAQITAAPPPLSGASERLAGLIYRLLEKDPERRPKNAGELGEELLGVMDALTYKPPTPRTSAGTRLDVRRASTDQRASSGARPSPERGSPSDLHVPFATGALQQFQQLSLHPVGIGSRKVPLWVPFLALSCGALLGTWLMLRQGLVVVEAPRPTPPAEIDPEGQRIIDARSGDRDAIASLRKLVAADEAQPLAAGKQGDPGKDAQQVSRYLALGRGYSVIKHSLAALEMYEHAVTLSPGSSRDPELLADVRSAMGSQDAVAEGIDFCVEHLGAVGADLIYDVYLDHLGQPGMTPVVARVLRSINGKDFIERASPALRVALQLKDAKVCAEYKAIIVDAVAQADDRSLQKLRALQVRRGCGSFGSKDCFPCLRSKDVQLDAAIARAETHAAPVFLAPEQVTPPL